MACRIAAPFWAALTLLIVMCLSVPWASAARDPVRFTVLTYNIHHGERLDGVLDLGGQAEYILSTGADIVALQEVDRGTARTGRVDQAAFLATATGFHYVFTPHFDYQGGEYGLALLSRYPIVAHESYRLPTAADAEPKSMLKATVEVNGTLIDVYVVHLEVRNVSVRHLQAQAVGEVIRMGRNPAVLMGDFNATPDSQVSLPWRSHLIDSYAAARFLGPAAAMEADPPDQRTYTGGGATWPVHEPQNRSDAIWHSYELRPVGAVQAPLVEWSDHRPVLATFEVAGEKDVRTAALPRTWPATDQVAVCVSEAAAVWLERSGMPPGLVVATLTEWLAAAGFTVIAVSTPSEAPAGSIIIVPGGRFLTAEDLAALYRHVNAGGGIIAWGDAGVEGAAGEEVLPGFGALFGIEYLGWSYGYPTRDAVRVDPDAASWPADMPAEARFWQLEGPLVRVLPGAQHLGTWRTRSGEPAYRPEIAAAIVQNGRTLYFGATPLHPLDRDNPEMRALITGLVRYLASAREGD